MRLASLALLACLVPAVGLAQTDQSGEQDLLRKMLEAMQEATGAPLPAEPAPTNPPPEATPAMDTTPAAVAGQGDEAIVDASNVPAILEIAQGYGSATLGADSLGDPMISGTMGGRDYIVFFYGCENNANCTTLMFRSSFDTSNYSVADMAEWNRTQRFGIAYLDDEGAPTLQMDVNLFGGVTRLNLDDTFDWWRVVLDTFAQRIGF